MTRSSWMLASACLLAAAACDDQAHQWNAAIEGPPIAPEVTAAKQAAQDRAERALGDDDGRSILFGDLHVHSSYSQDGFLFSLPLLGGDGAHPPNDACDFARHCANLDFYALTDHAESLAPDHWEQSKQSVRECNARAGDAADPDLVAFTGFEWTQAGMTPEAHWGHRCVLFPGTADAQLPARPIASKNTAAGAAALAKLARSTRWVGLLDWPVHERFALRMEEMNDRAVCSADIASPEIEDTACLEIAPEPRDLHRKLDEWGFPAFTIPHGTAWGVYTPASTTIDKHLAAEQYSADRMPLVEIMSGHGNSEEFRDWAATEVTDDGNRCPEPVDGHLTCCWQAGEIMRERCGDLSTDECARRVELARTLAAQTWVNPFRVFPDAPAEAWLDCDQCRDCFKPSFGYRPRESVQYAMSLTQAAASESPRRFRFGFVASSDGHTGRPGNSYTQVDPALVSDVRGTPGFPYSLFQTILGGQPMDDPQMPMDPGAGVIGVASGQDLRVASFLFPAGLAAVHATDRSREAIWNAMERKEVYGTSGPRILLWFDLLLGGGGRAPMGSEHVLETNPHFEVRAVGSFEPKPGCPDSSREALSPERLDYLCRGECYHPSDQRRPIVAIEIIRIRPQQRAGEAPRGLIEDPWRRFECPPDPAGCRIEFRDEEFVASGRDALYYARALEAPSAALNGQPLETQFDAVGNPVSIVPCTPARIDEGGCPAEVSERAWSSPIFIDQARPRTASSPASSSDAG